MKKFLCLLFALCLLVSFSGCSLFGENESEPEPPVVEPEPEPEPPPPPKYLNPLTGREDLDEPFSGRPFGVAVNNITEGLPQSGVSAADIIVEIETEGGITRLMCLYADPARAEGGIGSIRSLRHQFVAAVYQWDPIIAHIGTSDYTQDYLNARGIKTMNGFYSEAFLYTDQERLKTYASEHCKFTNAALLEQGIEAMDLRTDWEPAADPAFNFAAEGEQISLSGGAATRVEYLFSGSYDGDFRYDAASGLYYKWQHGEKHIDAGADNAQLAFENVIVLFAPVYGLYGELIDVDYQAGGTGYYFSGGRYEEITWEKPAYDEPFVFYKADGSALELNAGKTHLGVVRNSLRSSLEISA